MSGRGQWVCSTGDQSSENHIGGLEVISGCGPVGIHRYGYSECTREAISGSGPVGKDHCKSLGEFWRESVGVVQWAWSNGCSPVGVSQDESVEHKGSQRCGLEGNSGCGPVGITKCDLRRSVGVVLLWCEDL